jgi:hypothetical protein
LLAGWEMKKGEPVFNGSGKVAPPHQISNTGALALSRIGEGKRAGLSENEELAGKVNPSTMLLVINYICNYALL